MSLPRIDCLFFTDATLPSFLAEDAGRAFAGDLLIELASAPTLALALGLDTPPEHPGLAGVLGGLKPSELAVTSARLPAPIVLAPGRPVGVGGVRAAVAALRTRHSPHRTITLLVPIADAPAIGATLALADRFAVAWNVAAFPHAELLGFCAWLRAEQIARPDNFAGLLAYTPELLDGVGAAHVQELEPLLAPLADLVPATPRQVLVPAG